MPTNRYTPDQVIAALRQAGGIHLRAAALLGCDPQTVARYIRRDPAIRAAYDACAPVRGGTPRYTPDQVEAALRRAGSHAGAAALLGCHAVTVAAYVARYPHLRALSDAALAERFPIRRCTPEQVAAALQRAAGVKSAAARLLGCAHHTLTTYIARFPAVRGVYESCLARRRAARAHRLESIAQALTQANGSVSQAAARLGCSTSTVYRAVAADPAVRDAYRPASRPHRQERYAPLLVAEALLLSGGIKSHAAARLGCSRSTVQAYIRRHPEVRAAWQEARDILLDNAESKLAKLVDEGNWQAVRYTLSTLGKDRGFTARRDAFPASPSLSEDREAAVRALAAEIEAALRHHSASDPAPAVRGVPLAWHPVAERSGDDSAGAPDL